MGQGAQWVNKYSFGDVLFRPLFDEDGAFYAVQTLDGIKEIRIIQRQVGRMLAPQVQYQVYGSDNWMPEKELFRTRREALDYAKKQVQNSIDNLTRSLERIEKEYDPNDREDSE